MAATAGEIEAEIGAAFTPGDPDLDLAKLTVGQDLEDRGDVGIRAAHILAAVRAAEAKDAYEVGPNASLVLALKRIPSAGYRMLIMAVQADGKEWVADARRLYESSPDATPTQAFARFVEAFGCLLRGTDNALFVARRALGTPGTIGAVADGREVSVQAFIRATAEGTEASWIYAVDPQRYRAYVHRHGR